MNNLNKKRGMSIIGILVLVVLIILTLSYFQISVKSVVESPTGQENINYVGGGTKNLWTTYLAGPASYLWNDIWIDIFWKGFVSNMKNIRDGLPTDFDGASKNLEVEQ